MKTPLKSDKEELADLRKIAAEHSDCRWWFCIHHNISLETLYNDSTVEDRIAEILRSKPAEQHATRFRNLRPVVGELPTAVAETWAALNKASTAYDEAGVACNEAAAACNKAWAACSEARAARDKAGVTCNEAVAAYAEAGANYDKAWVAHNKAWTAYDKAQDAYAEALTTHADEITDLMNTQWPGNTWNGKNIGWK